MARNYHNSAGGKEHFAPPTRGMGNSHSEAVSWSLVFDASVTPTEFLEKHPDNPIVIP